MVAPTASVESTHDGHELNSASNFQNRLFTNSFTSSLLSPTGDTLDTTFSFPIWVANTPPTSEPLTPLAPLPPLTPLPSLAPRIVTQRHEIRPLPGRLDQVPVLHSNSPEVVFNNGILVSTFPPVGKRSPQAHLNAALDGRFDIFAHHIARTNTQEFGRPLYLGILLYNPNSRPVIVDVMQAAALFTNPDAPFIDLPSYVDNFAGNIYSGPGSRLSTDILRGVHQTRFPSQIILFPGESRMVMNEPVLIGSAVSALIRLRSNGAVYAATLALQAPIVPPAELPPPTPPTPPRSTNSTGNAAPPPRPTPPPPPVYRPPTILEWEDLIRYGSLATPRDLTPTPPNRPVITTIYGRVAGIAVGSVWQGRLVDQGGRQDLSIPDRGQAFSYVINTLNQGTFGTGQDQSAPMVARYPDTAYRSNGNYGVQYNLSLPLQNMTQQTQAVSILLQTPLKQDEASQGLQFLEPPSQEVFYRGTIRIAYQDDFGLPRTRSIHVVQNRGQQGQPLITLRMSPGDRRLITVDFIYPPDATPPQVLTIRSTDPATTLSELRDSNGNFFTDQPSQLPGQLPQQLSDRPNPETRNADAVAPGSVIFERSNTDGHNSNQSSSQSLAIQNINTQSLGNQSLGNQTGQNLDTQNLDTQNPPRNLDSQSLGIQNLGNQNLGGQNPVNPSIQTPNMQSLNIQSPPQNLGTQSPNIQGLDAQNLGGENLPGLSQSFNLNNQTTQNR
ncbi:MAG: DUF3370 domain-containing protein [Coleofasciculaceae cyanobacterium SM2_1_6]|nr:DUF3370 domain-containing protein [Coleofasciculaceae cyanobacterium SM2_1_6]